MDWLQALGPTLLTLSGGAVAWIIKSRHDELRKTEESLNNERRKAYERILEPYIRILADFKGKGPTQALNEIKSFDYGKTVFALTLFGSDDVIRAYNELWQHTYKSHEDDTDENEEERAKKYVILLGTLQLAIRRDVGPRKTKLRAIDMLRWKFSDIDRWST